MGKKSLLAPTSGEISGNGNVADKEPKPRDGGGTAKKTAPASQKKGAAAAKKGAPGSKSKAKKAAVKKAVPKKAVKKAAPKKAVPKKAVPKKAAPKKAVKKAAPKKAVKKAAPKKVVKKAAAPKTVKKSVPVKTAPLRASAKSKAKKAPVSVNALLKKRFESPVSGKAYTPPVKKRPDVISPPFFAGASPEETQRVRKLLFKKFDLSSVDAKSAPGLGGAPAESTPSAGDLALSPAVDDREPMGASCKLMLSGIGILAVLLFLVLWSSASNVEKYYVQPAADDLEIWKGRFSPQGRERIFTLEGVSAPEQFQEVYTREEAYSLIFAGVVNTADALLNSAQVPDFERIRRTLESARPYAVSPAASELLQKRLDKIDMMALVYKADILAGNGTVADLASARESLEQALELNLEAAEKRLLAQKIRWIDSQLAAMED